MELTNQEFKLEHESQSDRDRERKMKRKLVYERDRERILARNKERRKRPEIAKKQTEWSKQWYRNNKDKWNAYRRSDHYKQICKTWRKRNQEGARNSWLKCRYGITIEDYNRMFERQCGVCAICKRPELSKNKWGTSNKNLAVDHCYSTNIIRGLLCRRCNTFLGVMQDRKDWIQNALDYLKAAESQTAIKATKIIKPWKKSSNAH